MAAVEVPQTLEYRGGQLNAAPVLEVENFTNWKKRFMCHIIGIEPQFENIISNGPYIPMAAGQRKPEGQWTADERKAANLDQRLKSLIMSVLPDDQMNSVINCLTAKSTWDDLILYHEGPSDVKERIDYSPDDEEDTRSSHEYLNDLEEEYQARALLAKSKRFFKKGKNKGLIAKMYDWDDEEVSSDENEVTEVKALMALTDEERVLVGKESARNDNSDMSITSSNIPKSSEYEDSTLPNQDTDESDESLVCSTPLLSLKKLDGAEPVSGLKTIKSILKSKSTFKAETLKGKIKNVKKKDDPHWLLKRETLQEGQEWPDSLQSNQELFIKSLRTKNLLRGVGYLSVAKKAILVDKVAMFSAETEGIAAGGCCANILWTCVNILTMISYVKSTTENGACCQEIQRSFWALSSPFWPSGEAQKLLRMMFYFAARLADLKIE
ncbi:hypothetical protein Tco_0960790 [Tanacetum coccineum]